LAFDRTGRRLLDWECGDRDAVTLTRLLERLKCWKVTLYGTDDYGPYDTLLPVGRHYIGKDQTVAIERVNSRLRHWFARFRRRTCVVSKAIAMVDVTIALFAAYHINGTGTKLTSPHHCLLKTLILKAGAARAIIPVGEAPPEHCRADPQIQGQRLILLGPVRKPPRFAVGLSPGLRIGLC
jgi:insertion element IS1 protein InsB